MSFKLKLECTTSTDKFNTEREGNDYFTEYFENYGKPEISQQVTEQQYGVKHSSC